MKKIHYVLLFLPFPLVAIGIEVAIPLLGDSIADSIDKLAPRRSADAGPPLVDRLAMPDDLDASLPPASLEEASAFDGPPFPR